jgi:hypothetical protein
MSQSHIEEHIDLIAKHEQDFLVRRTPSERLGDTIAGAGGPGLTHNKIWVPHLRDGVIVAKVGIRAKARSAFLPWPLKSTHIPGLARRHNR